MNEGVVAAPLAEPLAPGTKLLGPDGPSGWEVVGAHWLFGTRTYHLRGPVAGQRSFAPWFLVERRMVEP